MPVSADLLAVYGLGLPFVAAAAIGPFMRASNALKKQFGKIEKTVGVLLVVTGIAFLTGAERVAAADRDVPAVRAGGVKICLSGLRDAD